MAGRGLLVVFEGLDQSGKQTQAEALRDWLIADGRSVRLLSFPTYDSALGAEIGRALHGERDYGADVMQLLYVANRFEWKTDMVRALSEGTTLLCDRYRASSVAYGEAQGLDPAWLDDIQRDLPPATITLWLDIAPEVAAQRKAANRDRYERDLALLARVRESYRQQASRPGWVRIAADGSKDDVAREVAQAVLPRLAPSSAPGPA